ELGSPEIPMTRLPPLLPTGSALYFVAVMSMPAAADAEGAVDPPADAAGAVEGAVEAGGAGLGLGELDPVRRPPETTIPPTAATLNKRFRIQVLLLKFRLAS